MSDLLEMSDGRFIRNITSSYRQKSIELAAKRGANIKEVEDFLDQIEDLGKKLSAINEPAMVTLDEIPSMAPISMYRRSLDSPSRWETRPPVNENCAYNARSPHLKCTVHPIGSCDGCKDFEFSPKISQSFLIVDEPAIALKCPAVSSPINSFHSSNPEEL
jgi:Family of unknown function (DUF6464)